MKIFNNIGKFVYFSLWEAVRYWTSTRTFPFTARTKRGHGQAMASNVPQFVQYLVCGVPVTTKVATRLESFFALELAIIPYHVHATNCYDLVDSRLSG